MAQRISAGVPAAAARRCQSARRKPRAMEMVLSWITIGSMRIARVAAQTKPQGSQWRCRSEISQPRTAWWSSQRRKRTSCASSRWWVKRLQRMTSKRAAGSRSKRSAVMTRAGTPAAAV